MLKQRLKSFGLNIGTIIVSTDLKPQMKTWAADVFSQYQMNPNFGPKINNDVENNLSIIQSSKVLGYNWCVIPTDDVYKVIEPKTIYIVTGKQYLGGFIRSKGIKTITHFFGNIIVAHQEYYTCSVMNPNNVYKIKVN